MDSFKAVLNSQLSHYHWAASNQSPLKMRASSCHLILKHADLKHQVELWANAGNDLTQWDSGRHLIRGLRLFQNPQHPALILHSNWNCFLEVLIAHLVRFVHLLFPVGLGLHPLRHPPSLLWGGRYALDQLSFLSSNQLDLTRSHSNQSYSYFIKWYFNYVEGIKQISCLMKKTNSGQILFNFEKIEENGNKRWIFSIQM